MADAGMRIVEERWDHLDVARIVLDMADKPVNLLTPAIVASLGEMLDTLIRTPPSALILESAKPGVFIAGADIHVLASLESREDAERTAREGRDILWKLHTIACPTFAAIDGVALGGGLEAALFCDYRIVSDHPKTRLGLPEVQLGIIPGFGGTQTLPRLIGIRAALDMILTGRQIDGRRAEKIGLADLCAPHDIFDEQVRRFILSHPRKSQLPRRARPFFLMREIVCALAKRSVIKKTRGHYPAPLRAIDAVRRGVGRPILEGMAIESALFAGLPSTPECKNLIRTFFQTEKFKKMPYPAAAPPESTPIPIPSSCAVIGAGVMGAGIAGHLASCGLNVRLKDIEPSYVQSGLRAIGSIVSSRLKRRRISREEARDIAGRVAPALSKEPLRSAMLVIEAVVEDPGVKRAVFDEIESVVSGDCVIATNTSSLPISDMTEGRKRRDRFVGLHFFNPVDKMPLVEIVVADETSDDVRRFAVEFVKRIRKTPIVAKDRPGFLVNRLLMPYLNEAVILLSEGFGIDTIDRAALTFGMPMGPLALIDVVGIDVAEKVALVLHGAYGDRMAPSPFFARMKQDKRLGKKNGKGFYLYGGRGGKKVADQSLRAGLPAERRGSDGELIDRLILSMVNEAARALEDGVVSDAETVDVGMLLGAGFPPFRGGLLKYADDRGIDSVSESLARLAESRGARFNPARLISDYARTKSRFHPVSK